MSSRMPVIFLELWHPSETWTFFETLPGVKHIMERGVLIGLMIPYEIMDMQHPIVQNFKNKLLETFTGVYRYIVCWRVPSSEKPF